MRAIELVGEQIALHPRGMRLCKRLDVLPLQRIGCLLVFLDPSVVGGDVQLGAVRLPGFLLRLLPLRRRRIPDQRIQLVLPGKCLCRRPCRSTRRRTIGRRWRGRHRLAMFTRHFVAQLQIVREVVCLAKHFELDLLVVGRAQRLDRPVERDQVPVGRRIRPIPCAILFLLDARIEQSFRMPVDQRHQVLRHARRVVHRDDRARQLRAASAARGLHAVRLARMQMESGRRRRRETIGYRLGRRVFSDRLRQFTHRHGVRDAATPVGRGRFRRSLMRFRPSARIERAHVQLAQPLSVWPAMRVDDRRRPLHVRIPEPDDAGVARVRDRNASRQFLMSGVVAGLRRFRFGRHRGFRRESHVVAVFRDPVRVHPVAFLVVDVQVAASQQPRRVLRAAALHGQILLLPFADAVRCILDLQRLVHRRQPDAGGRDRIAHRHQQQTMLVAKIALRFCTSSHRCHVLRVGV